MHDQREIRQSLRNRLDPVERQFRRALELVGAVAGADRHRQAVAAGLVHEPLRLVRIGEVLFDLAVRDAVRAVLDPAEWPSSASTLTYGLCACARSQIFFVSAMFFFERVARAVVHHRGVSLVNALHRRLEIAVVEVDRDGISGDSAQPASISARR